MIEKVPFMPIVPIKYVFLFRFFRFPNSAVIFVSAFKKAFPRTNDLALLLVNASTVVFAIAIAAM